jgi:hypothetical protein
MKGGVVKSTSPLYISLLSALPHRTLIQSKRKFPHQPHLLAVHSQLATNEIQAIHTSYFKY